MDNSFQGGFKAIILLGGTLGLAVAIEKILSKVFNFEVNNYSLIGVMFLWFIFCVLTGLMLDRFNKKKR